MIELHLIQKHIFLTAQVWACVWVVEELINHGIVAISVSAQI